MTCIVGIEYKDHVYMCGDRAASSLDNISVTSSPKVYKKFMKKSGQPVLIGWAGGFLFGNILQYKYVPPEMKSGMTPDEYVFNCLIKDLRKCAETNHHQQIDDPSYTLIGVCGKLYTLQADYSMVRNQCGYDAIGSGAEYAIGAIHALLQTQGLKNPHQLLTTAIAASAAFSTSVRGPFDCISSCEENDQC